MTQDAIGRLRSRLKYPSDGRSQTVTAIETIVRKDDLRTLLTALDGDEVTEEMIDAGSRAWMNAGGTQTDSADLVGPIYLAMRGAALKVIGGVK